MKTKEEIRNWILENCVNELDVVDLNEIDFGRTIVDFSFIKAAIIRNKYQEADTINNSNQNAKKTIRNDKQISKELIWNDGQKSNVIYNDSQHAFEVCNDSQRATVIVNNRQEARKIRS